jgi:hypothetical protein
LRKQQQKKVITKNKKNMETTITDNGASLKLTIGTQVRNITKSHIVEVSVIKTNIIKIDIGLGALNNIYIPYADVTNPVTANVEALRDAVLAFIPASSSGTSSGLATEAKQNESLIILNALRTMASSIDGKTSGEPLLTDESGAGTVYKGFAVTGALPEDAVWAIQRVQRVSEVNIITWAGGLKDFTHIWNERETLTYK